MQQFHHIFSMLGRKTDIKTGQNLAKLVISGIKSYLKFGYLVLELRICNFKSYYLPLIVTLYVVLLYISLHISYIHVYIRIYLSQNEV